MKVVEFDSPGPFLERAADWLSLAPVDNNLPLGIARGVAEIDGKAFFATVEESGQIVAAAVWTPPHRVIVTRATESAIDALVEHIAGRSLKPSGVLGPNAAARHFADEWVGRFGVKCRTAFEQGLYALDKVVWPRPVAGTLRQAGPQDLDLVTEWAARFSTDAGLGGVSPTEAKNASARRIAAGAVYLWDDEGARSMAGLARSCSGVVAVTYVYTPDRERGRGFAKACVSALSQLALDGGHTACVLYSDLANAISTHIYKSIGYVSVDSAVVLDFV